MTGAAGNRRRRPPPEPRAGAGPGILTRMCRDMLHSLAGTRLYRHTLLGRVPSGIELKIGQAWPGDPKRGAAIAAGEIELAGRTDAYPVSALVSGQRARGMAGLLARLWVDFRSRCRRGRGTRCRPRTGAELADAGDRLSLRRLALRRSGDSRFRLDKPFRRNRRRRPAPRPKAGDAGEPGRPESPPRPHRRVAARRCREVACAEGADCRNGCARRFGGAVGKGADRARTRDGCPNSARWRSPLAQPVGAAQDPSRSGRHPDRTARGEDRDARCAAGRHRPGGTATEAVPPWRSPPCALQ